MGGPDWGPHLASEKAPFSAGIAAIRTPQRGVFAPGPSAGSQGSPKGAVGPTRTSNRAIRALRTDQGTLSGTIEAVDNLVRE